MNTLYDQMFAMRHWSLHKYDHNPNKVSPYGRYE